MGKFETAFTWGGLHRLQKWRHVVQLIVFLFLNAKLLGLSSTKLVVPYLTGTQGPFATVSGAFEATEYSIARGIVPLTTLGIIFLTAVTVGRVFCGWACPFGMVQDFLSYLPFKKERTSPTAESFKDVKWILIAFSFITTILVGFRRATDPDSYPVGAFSDSPFSVLNPAGTLFAYIPWMLLWKSNILATSGIVGWLKLGLLIGALVPSLYIPRFFCRYACPMGAMLEPLSKFKFLRIQRSPKLHKEEFNKIVGEVCPMGVQLQSEESDFIDHPLCVHCGKCVTEAPGQLTQKVL